MKPFPLRIAVGSKSGLSVDVHFGHAKQFLVYEVTPDQCRLLETREVGNYCHGKHGSESAMQKILFTIKDCQAVFSAMIGEGPKSKLAAIQVESVTDYGYEAIEESLLEFARLYRQRSSAASEA